MFTLLRYCAVLAAALLMGSVVLAEEADCSAWTLDGIGPGTTEAEFLSSFGDEAPERVDFSPKNKPRYIHPDYRPELGSDLSCISKAESVLGNSAITYFDKNGLVRHLIQLEWPHSWFAPLIEARQEAEQRRRGRSVPGKGDAILEEVTKCHAEIRSLLESRLGPPDEELRSIEIPASPIRLYRASSWTNVRCGAQIVFGLFTATTVSADDSECCGEPTIALLPIASKKR